MRLTGSLEPGTSHYSQIETQGTSVLSLNGQKATRSRGRTPSPLPSFLEQFALRATRMLDASWGAVVVYKGRDNEFHARAGKPGPASPSAAEWLIANARDAQTEIETR